MKDKAKKTFAKHIPRKRFGQNFLKDTAIIEHIISVIHPQPQDHVVEIGGGLGALTKPLLEQVEKLDCIEIDRDLSVQLMKAFENFSNFTLHTIDALHFNLKSLHAPCKSLRIIGNLPYNISTPLLFHLLKQYEYIQDMHFMLQKEVVDRITAKPNSKAYGKLTIMIQYYCDVERLFLVPPSAFYPPPKVYSAVIRLIPYNTVPHQAYDFALLETLVSQAFNHRRKMLSTTLKDFLNTAEFAKLNLDPKSRPEQLSLEAWINLSNLVYRKINSNISW